MSEDVTFRDGRWRTWSTRRGATWALWLTGWPAWPIPHRQGGVDRRTGPVVWQLPMDRTSETDCAILWQSTRMLAVRKPYPATRGSGWLDRSPVLFWLQSSVLDWIVKFSSQLSLKYVVNIKPESNNPLNTPCLLLEQDHYKGKISICSN